MQNTNKKGFSKFFLKQLRKTLIIFTVILIILTFILYSFTKSTLEYRCSDRIYSVTDAILSDLLEGDYNEQNVLDKINDYKRTGNFPQYKTGSAFRILDADDNVIFSTAHSAYAYIGYSVIGDVPEESEGYEGNNYMYAPIANLDDCIEVFEKHYGKNEIYIDGFYLTQEKTSEAEDNEIFDMSVYLGHIIIFDENYDFIEEYNFTPYDIPELYMVQSTFYISEERPEIIFFGTDYDNKALNILYGENEDLKFGTYHVPVGCGFVRDNSFKNYYYSTDADSSTISYTDDESGYRVEAVVVFDVLDSVIGRIIAMWIVGIVLAVVITYITAHTKYNKYVAQAEIDLYRQNLTNSLAHDLKTPLTAICGYAQNLKDNVNTDKKDYYADAVIENAEYMNRIISDTLELSRLEYHETLEKENVDIIEITNELISKYKPLADEKEKTFSVSGACTAKADRRLIARAIENLITNALRYSLPDSTIKINADNKTFVIKNRCKDSIVGDEKVFCEPFKKADNSRSNKSGTGIGLSIVKSITTLHGFKLEINAQNSEFTAKIIF